MHRGLHLAPGRMDRCGLLRTGTVARRRRSPGRAVPGRPAWQARVHNAAGRAMGTELARPSSPGTEHLAFSLTRPSGSPVPLEEEAGRPGPGKPGPPLLGPSPLTAAAPGEHLSFGKNPPQCRNPKIASSNIRPAPVNEAIAPQNAICPTLPNAYAFSSSPRSVSSRNTNKRCSARYRHWPFRCIKPRALPPA